jgi:hypothetical protein
MSRFHLILAKAFAVLALLLTSVAVIPHFHGYQGIITPDQHSDFCPNCELGHSFSSVSFLRTIAPIDSKLFFLASKPDSVFLSVSDFSAFLSRGPPA